MPEMLHEAQVPVSASAYRNNWEHLSDEFKRLDLLIRIQILKQDQAPQPAGPLDQLKGLVISEEEIQGILNNNQDFNQNQTGPEINSLIKELDGLDTRIRRRRLAAVQQKTYLALPQLARIFNLSSFEEQCILICLAPEIDRKYEKLYAYLQDDITRKKPSVDLILSLLLKSTEEKLAARTVFDPQGPLLRFLLQCPDTISEETAPLISRFLKLDDRIVNFLLDINSIDRRLEKIVRLVTPGNSSEAGLIIPEELSQVRSVAKAASHRQMETGKRIIFYFHGPYGTGKKRWAELICSDFGLPVLLVNLQKVLSSPVSNPELLQLLGREAVLQQAALVIDNFQMLLENQDKYQAELDLLIEMIRTFVPVAFLISDRPWKPLGSVNGMIFVEQEFTIPPAIMRDKYWESFSKGYRLAPGIDLASVGVKFKFTPGQIRDSLANAEHLALQHSNQPGRIETDDLYTACHNQSNQKLGTLARKIKPKYRWDDIVLPRDQQQQLREICNQVKYRQIVYGEWGFDRKLSLGKGLTSLFCGVPGTGKTMAAEIIAGELQLELYKIDLSQVASKYIGETEKNLARIFSEAETSNAILFFDEADALFGKRSEVKDAHDRYANIEIGYLLQRMEEYEGIVILATNLNKNIDEAFLRRIQFIIEFPFPDSKEREEMWRKIFPAETPKAPDLDYSFLGERLKITGGNIKNIILNAAFYAAGDGAGIGMKHILRAARREYQKMGKSFFKSDFEPYSDLLEGESYALT
ncbi:MAG: ATP-binding protein [Firmicutes bacterium]|nr:ATP-binding protein [Bacillota bacterium]